MGVGSVRLHMWKPLMKSSQVDLHMIISGRVLL